FGNSSRAADGAWWFPGPTTDCEARLRDAGAGFRAFNGIPWTPVATSTEPQGLKAGQVVLNLPRNHGGQRQNARTNKSSHESASPLWIDCGGIVGPILRQGEVAPILAGTWLQRLQRR